ncbi:unnamed protein product [Ranitomeya imitator]|uniref:Helix-turn-helix domain-containing protein n=1 Tax=Ranitomeya imitator TaxID=111125 RepID=A0ABN9KZI5_9NEOB|nr:unnamed protein product [Ranitomeya imitator]
MTTSGHATGFPIQRQRGFQPSAGSRNAAISFNCSISEVKVPGAVCDRGRNVHFGAEGPSGSAKLDFVKSRDIVPVYQIKGISKLVKLCLPKVQCFCDSLTSPPSERQFNALLMSVAKRNLKTSGKPTACKTILPPHQSCRIPDLLSLTQYPVELILVEERFNFPILPILMLVCLQENGAGKRGLRRRRFRQQESAPAQSALSGAIFLKTHLQWSRSVSSRKWRRKARTAQAPIPAAGIGACAVRALRSREQRSRETEPQAALEPGKFTFLLELREADSHSLQLMPGGGVSSRKWRRKAQTAQAPIPAAGIGACAVRAFRRHFLEDTPAVEPSVSSRKWRRKARTAQAPIPAAGIGACAVRAFRSREQRSRETEPHAALEPGKVLKYAIKKSIPISQFQRVERIVTDSDTRNQRLQEMEEKFSSRGYPKTLLSVARHSTPKPKTPGSCIPFVNTYHPYSRRIQASLHRHWSILIKSYPNVPEFQQPFLSCYHCPSNIKDKVVRADIGPSNRVPRQFFFFFCVHKNGGLSHASTVYNAIISKKETKFSTPTLEGVSP